MLMYEAGPFKMFTRLRERFSDAVHFEDGTLSIMPNGIWGCMYCMSVWVGVLNLLMPVWLCAIFALSAGAVLVDKINDRLAA